MPILMVNQHFEFPNVTGSVQKQTRVINFNGEGGNIKHAAVVLQGFELRYSNGDHHLLQERVQVNIVTNRNNVLEVEATFLLRDGSGNIDDPYAGSIDAVVIVDIG